jgi:phospholipase C
MPQSLKHVFVLMFENRSFDHMLGFSGLTGTDAVTSVPTSIEGLTGQESNVCGGVAYPVTRVADCAMPADPGHEFLDVLQQLCGTQKYSVPYPPIDGSGFVESYIRASASAKPADIMKCFDTPHQLPVLFTLAQEFAVCDHWFASVPGPTWPNRMFVHGASSGGLDHSPSTPEIAEWETVSGFILPHGTVYSSLKASGRRFGLYSADEFPMVAALKGVTLGDVHRIDTLLADLKRDPFPYDYVFIEPSYNILNDFRGSSSQHPLADVRDGEALLKTVYEALRSSPAWDSSLLIVLWDEHGGFYDHVAPPPAPAPDDSPPSKYDQSGFTFQRYGVRVPAVVISPLIPRSTIDHRVYDHASVLATLEKVFGLSPLTCRDANAADVLPLLCLSSPRSDTPLQLPVPSLAPLGAPTPRALTVDPGAASPVTVARPDDPVNAGMLPTVLHAALRQDLEASPGSKVAALARFAAVKTRADALTYLQEVRAKVRGM